MTNSPWIGYCTNVHAGADLATNQANLREHAVAVKAQVRPDNEMGVGLWLPAEVARKLRGEAELQAFGDWLREAGLSPFTFNGFPYGDFHQPVVKHNVYLPTWFEQQRRDYTIDLIEIQHALLPQGQYGSISTSPLAWGSPAMSVDQLQASAAHLAEVAERLVQLEAETGRCICISIEPEPGCELQRSHQIVDFFENYLLKSGNEAGIRRHIGVCHDVCHAAVMFEDQAEVLKRYSGAGLRVGKMQISSAVCLNLDEISSEDGVEALKQLAAFSEDRYLHQTVHRDAQGDVTFYEDLPAALVAMNSLAKLNGELRVHFHVPVYLESFGHLQTSRSDIAASVRAARDHTDCEHFEVETYAWGVLPSELQKEKLADGIAAEMNWFETLWAELA